MATTTAIDAKRSHVRQSSTERSIARQRAKTSHNDLPLLEEDMSPMYFITEAAQGVKDTALMLQAAVTQIVAPYDLSAASAAVQ
ncbi:hypothetical protein FRB96_002248 [Tulasnella sp. 330]|nr:hypothetical protein FRB96_002248 [Tulasnella sp. 330]KAG8873718.1 hypothetical protein FRB97_006515 [Tulasnella sp. 331]KAG8877994.1 hypothetical protein FRB98_006419 [Tulasnella sp. 332]